MVKERPLRDDSAVPLAGSLVVEMPNPEQTRWFEDEVQPHDARLRAYLRSAFPGVRDVDDVVQESYLRLWRTHAVRPIRLAKAFLFTVARRIAIDLVRRERRAPFVSVKDPGQLLVLDAAPDAASNEESQMEIQLLTEAVDALPRRCREIFSLCQIEGLTQAEVARRLGLSENTVAVQASRGLQRCEEYVRRRLNRP